MHLAYNLPNFLEYVFDDFSKLRSMKWNCTVKIQWNNTMPKLVGQIEEKPCLNCVKEIPFSILPTRKSDFGFPDPVL